MKFWHSSIDFGNFKSTVHSNTSDDLFYSSSLAFFFFSQKSVNPWQVTVYNTQFNSKDT